MRNNFWLETWHNIFKQWNKKYYTHPQFYWTIASIQKDNMIICIRIRSIHIGELIIFANVKRNITLLIFCGSFSLPHIFIRREIKICKIYEEYDDMIYIKSKLIMWLEEYKRRVYCFHGWYHVTVNWKERGRNHDPQSIQERLTWHWFSHFSGW